MERNNWMVDEGVYATYKFYTHKGERLAIFGKDNGDGRLKIVMFKCSKKDQFSKQMARKAFVLYNNGVDGEFHPERIDVVIGAGNSARYEFIKFCFDNYYQKKSIALGCSEECLLNINKGVIIRTGRLTKYRKIYK